MELVCTQKIVDAKGEIIIYKIYNRISNETILASKKEMYNILGNGVNIANISLSTDGKIRTSGIVEEVPDFFGLDEYGNYSYSQMLYPKITRPMIETINKRWKDFKNLETVIVDFAPLQAKFVSLENKKCKALLMGIEAPMDIMVFDRNGNEIALADMDFYSTVVVKKGVPIDTNTNKMVYNIKLLTQVPPVIDNRLGPVFYKEGKKGDHILRLKFKDKCYASIDMTSTFEGYGGIGINSDLRLDGMDWSYTIHANRAFFSSITHDIEIGELGRLESAESMFCRAVAYNLSLRKADLSNLRNALGMFRLFNSGNKFVLCESKNFRSLENADDMFATAVMEDSNVNLANAQFGNLRSAIGMFQCSAIYSVNLSNVDMFNTNINGLFDNASIHKIILDGAHLNTDCKRVLSGIPLRNVSDKSTSASIIVIKQREINSYNDKIRKLNY